jgi:hypothetical protein
MPEKMTIVYHQRGHVLAALTRAAESEGKLEPTQVAGDVGVVVHAPDNYEHWLAVPPADLQVKTVDLLREVFFGPYRYGVENDQPALWPQPSTSGGTPDVKLTKTAGTLTIEVNGAAAKGPKVDEKITVIVRNQTTSEQQPPQTGTAVASGTGTKTSVAFTLQSGDYDVLVLAARYQAVLERITVP